MRSCTNTNSPRSLLPLEPDARHARAEAIRSCQTRRNLIRARVNLLRWTLMNALKLARQASNGVIGTHKFQDCSANVALASFAGGSRLVRRPSRLWQWLDRPVPS